MIETGSTNLGFDPERIERLTRRRAEEEKDGDGWVERMKKSLSQGRLNLAKPPHLEPRHQSKRAIRSRFQIDL